MNTLPTIKADLIAGMDERRAKARAFVDTVSPDLKVHGDSEWTAKDLITHLTAFEEDLIEAIQTFVAGNKYRLDLRGATSIDDFNELRREESADKSWEQALIEWQTIRDQLRGLIIVFPESQLDDPFSTPFLQKFTLMQAIKFCGAHEKLHINEIKSAVNL